MNKLAQSLEHLYFNSNRL